MLAPLRVEERFCVEIERLRHEAAVGFIRCGVDRRTDGADDLGKLVRAQRHARNNAKAASAAPQRPEEVGVRAGVGKLHSAIGGHHLSLDQVGRGRAEGLGETTEAAAVYEARDAHGQDNHRPAP